MIQNKQALKSAFLVTGTIIGCFALGAQLYLVLKNAQVAGLNALAETIRFLSYMTIWTNILVMLLLLCSWLMPGSGLAAFLKRPVVQAGAALYMLIVAIGYHFFLADIWNPSGLQYLADKLLHYVMPFLYLLYWLLFAPKGLLKWRDSLVWLIYPLVYMLYTLGRGAIGHEYPYPFIDVSQLGYGMVIRNALLFGLAYLVLGALFVFADSRFRASSPLVPRQHPGK